MKKYLLLRDNKQTGPHSCEEILQMGLKAYDLIWVDGKSAAWRYPGELPEFKEHAPPIVEQPFDRFFRKPQPDIAITASKETPSLQGSGAQGMDEDIPTLSRFMQEQAGEKQKERESRSATMPRQEEQKPEQEPPAKESGTSGPRYVSVKLPASSGEQKVVVINRAETEKKDSDRESVQVPASDDQESRPGHRAAILFPERDPLAAVPPSRKPGTAVPLLQYAAIVLGILSFLGLGVLIGIKWTRARLIPATTEQGSTVNRVVPEKDLAEPDNINLMPARDSLGAALKAEAISKSTKKAKKDSSGSKPLIAENINTVDVARELDPAVLQEEERKRREAEEKERTKNNIAQVIGLQADKYKVGMFGGISDMQVTVSNASGFPIDLVVVEVDYLQSNKKVFKTETLRFKDLSPHGNQTLELPKTSRGIKTESRITHISSRELDLSYTPN
jgi:hypothetical protein